jgi:hypothetical protein
MQTFVGFWWVSMGTTSFIAHHINYLLQSSEILTPCSIDRKLCTTFVVFWNIRYLVLGWFFCFVFLFFVFCFPFLTGVLYFHLAGNCMTWNDTFQTWIPLTRLLSKEKSGSLNELFKKKSYVRINFSVPFHHKSST